LHLRRRSKAVHGQLLLSPLCEWSIDSKKIADQDQAKDHHQAEEANQSTQGTDLAVKSPDSFE